MMDIEKFIEMLESRGYADGAPVVISTDDILVYSTTFEDFKAEWARYRIY